MHEVTGPEPAVIDADAQDHNQDVVMIAADPWVETTKPRPAYMGRVGGSAGEGNCQMQVFKVKASSAVEVCFWIDFIGNSRRETKMGGGNRFILRSTPS